MRLSKLCLGTLASVAFLAVFMEGERTNAAPVPKEFRACKACPCWEWFCHWESIAGNDRYFEYWYDSGDGWLDQIWSAEPIPGLGAGVGCPSPPDCYQAKVGMITPGDTSVFVYEFTTGTYKCGDNVPAGACTMIGATATGEGTYINGISWVRCNGGPLD